MEHTQAIQPTSHTVHAMLVEDSAIIRGLMRRALEADPRIAVVATAVNGKIALDTLPLQPVDVIVLDIEMPVMDGMEALPRLLAMSPDTRIIMASTLTQRNADISLRALKLGASDYIPKPNAQENSETLSQFYKELCDKVAALGEEPARKRNTKSKGQLAAPVDVAPKKSAILEPARYPGTPIRAVAFASSTGGPQALLHIIPALKGKTKSVPIFITQHMPPTFTAILADHIGKDSSIPCAEAKNGEKAEAGHIYIAPGDYHMRAHHKDGYVTLSLDQDSPINFCRPAADPMIQSLADCYSYGLLVIVLTGMGRDGADGAVYAAGKGATVVAQDESTSVVWGMPGAVAQTRVQSALLPLADIAPYVIKAIGGHV